MTLHFNPPLRPRPGPPKPPAAPAAAPISLSPHQTAARPRPRPPLGPTPAEMSCIAFRRIPTRQNSSRSITRQVGQKPLINPSPPVHNLCITCAQPPFTCAQPPHVLCPIHAKSTFNMDCSPVIRQNTPTNIRLRGPPPLRNALGTATCAQILCPKTAANQYVSPERS